MARYIAFSEHEQNLAALRSWGRYCQVASAAERGDRMRGDAALKPLMRAKLRRDLQNLDPTKLRGADIVKRNEECAISELMRHGRNELAIK
jgi:hypothetical protein